MIEQDTVEAVNRLLGARQVSKHERREAIRLARAFAHEGSRPEEAAEWGVMFALHEWPRRGSTSRAA